MAGAGVYSVKRSTSDAPLAPSWSDQVASTKVTVTVTPAPDTAALKASVISTGYRKVRSLVASVNFWTAALLTVKPATELPSARVTDTRNSAAESRMDASFMPTRFGSW